MQNIDPSTPTSTLGLYTPHTQAACPLFLRTTNVTLFTARTLPSSGARVAACDVTIITLVDTQAAAGMGVVRTNTAASVNVCVCVRYVCVCVCLHDKMIATG